MSVVQKFLFPLIQKHIAPGTVIRTDRWRGYFRLPEYGYEHQTVNHSIGFVTPEEVHTNRIESMWRPMRAFFIAFIAMFSVLLSTKVTDLFVSNQIC